MSKETEHTKGPWEAQIDPYSFAPGRITALERDNILNSSLIADCHFVHSSMNPEETLARSVANTLLVAAAPKLLEALEKSNKSISFLYGLAKINGASEEDLQGLKEA